MIMIGPAKSAGETQRVELVIITDGNLGLRLASRLSNPYGFGTSRFSTRHAAVLVQGVF